MSSPFAWDAMLAGESVVIPPVTGQSWSVNIRAHSARPHPDDLVAVDICPADARLPGGGRLRWTVGPNLGSAPCWQNDVARARR